MEHKLSKKAKIFLSVASAIITNTAITTLLTSCSLSNKISDIGGFDKEYGINESTYTRMEEDFEALYKLQLDQKRSSGEISDDTYDSNLCAFQNNLNSIHTSLYSGENKTLSYTIKTNVLRDYARDNYGIRLSRQSSVILNEAISDIKSSIINSVLLMCKEYGITDISEYRKNADAEFDKLENEARAKYGDADVVSIIQYIQSGMTTCFNGICEELDCVATQQQLKKFTEKYSINVKEDVADDYCWDKLFSKYGDGNREISVEDFNNIFEISYEDSDPQSNNIPYLLTSKKTEKFRNNLITGYTLKPILIKMNGDPYTNTYSIDVDYTLVKNNYINNKNVAQLTAHSSALKNKSFYEDENTSIFDLNASDEEREYTNYVLPITKEYEEEQINTIYFNNDDFKFSWSTSDEYGYDDFWTEANENGEYKGKLNTSSLATSGMMINGVLLLDILNQAGKISLSGGSYELNGIEKSEDSDTMQWKLVVDNNEIKAKDIRWELISATTTELPNSISITNGVVSWTNQIEVGTYQFCILANYKETKIHSAPITLTIFSKDAKNIENFEYEKKNILFDKSTIDQKLLDFVKNVNFSLEYTESDYNTPTNNKLGEIQVNDFIIGYKNSNNTFKASNSINKAISDAINNDSTITSRYSKNLYNNLKLNYLVAVLNKSFNNTILFDKIESMSEHIDNMYTAGLIIFSTCTALEAIFTLILISIIVARKSLINNLTKKIILAAACLLLTFIPAGYLISLLTEARWYTNDSLKWCKSSSQNDGNRTDFESKLIDDQKYFLISNGKDQFNKLSNEEIRSLAYFYTNFYIRPADYNKSDEKFAKIPYRMYDQYIEFNYELEKATKHLFGVLISGLALASISLVVSLTIFCICIRNLFNQANQQQAQVLVNNINGADKKIQSNANDIKNENDLLKQNDNPINGDGENLIINEEKQHIIDIHDSDADIDGKKGEIKEIFISKDDYEKAGGKKCDSVLNIIDRVPVEYLKNGWEFKGLNTSLGLNGRHFYYAEFEFMPG